MSFLQELASWNPFVRSHKVQKAPQVGDTAPNTSRLQYPGPDGKPAVVTFLRHCGCPFAEKTFLTVREFAQKNENVHFVAISHSDESATRKWLNDVGGAGAVEVIVDYERELYGAYGLGLSSIWHPLNSGSLSAQKKLGKEDSIGLRPTESGSRWQTAGMYGVDDNGKVKYAHIAQSAEDIGDIERAIAAVC